MFRLRSEGDDFEHSQAVVKNSHWASCFRRSPSLPVDRRQRPPGPCWSHCHARLRHLRRKLRPDVLPSVLLLALVMNKPAQNSFCFSSLTKKIQIYSSQIYVVVHPKFIPSSHIVFLKKKCIGVYGVTFQLTSFAFASFVDCFVFYTRTYVYISKPYHHSLINPCMYIVSLSCQVLSLLVK